MRLFQAADVTEMTGLSRSQLREWCSRDRRNLLPPDVEPDGPGRHALYTWQSTLALRILNVLHRDYAVEVAAWAPGMNDLRRKLDGVSFPSLWGCAVAFRTPQQVELISLPVEVQSDSMLLSLHPHLIALATKLAVAPPDQLPLFPAVVVSHERR